MERNKTNTFANVDEYIALQAEQAQLVLTHIRHVIKQTIPDAEEVISYQMPAYKYFGMVVFFAAFKNHYSLFFGPPVLVAFKSKIKGFDQTKSAIKFPFSTPLPEALVKEMVKYVAQENKQKALAKKAAKSKKK
ncbi:MAG: DUF1801 domain-containing protein [Bacteroidota bacterium]